MSAIAKRRNLKMIKSQEKKSRTNKKTISSSLKYFLRSCQVVVFIAAILTLPFLLESIDLRKKIEAPFLKKAAEKIPDEAFLALDQPYHFLGKGKQSLAFVSQDGSYVIKFFQKNYFKVPFYAKNNLNEWEKRDKRKSFYENSYLLANSYFAEESALLYCHLAKTTNLPKQQFSFWKINRTIDLNEYPFILQKKATPLFSYLNKENIDQGITQFINLIQKRISLNIQDHDHEIAANFGMIDEKIIQIDPGRFSFNEKIKEPCNLKKEWWSATHRFKKWLLIHYPDKEKLFDELLERAQSIQNDSNIDDLLQ